MFWGFCFALVLGAPTTSVATGADGEKIVDVPEPVDIFVSGAAQ